MRPFGCRADRIFTGVFLLLATWASGATAAPRCDRVLVYYRDAGSDIEWRAFDPSTKTDKVIRSLSAEPSFVAWDSTSSRVEFVIGDTIFASDWRVGAKACVVADPDNRRWALTRWEETGRVMSNDPGGPTCVYQRWDSSADGMEWHETSADTVACDMENCDYPESAISKSRRVPRLLPDDFGPSLNPESRGAEELPPNVGEPDSDVEKWFVPSASVDGHGVELSYFWTGQRVCAPVYLVDRARNKRRVLCGHSENATVESALMCEACGMLLVTCEDATRLFDIATGREIAMPRVPPTGNSMYWAPRLGD